MEPTANVTAVLPASVEPVVKPPAGTIKLVSPYLARCQSDRAKILDALHKETQQYTPEKKVEAYRSHILEFKAVKKAVFKADKDTAQIIHVHKIVDFLYCQCCRDQRPASSPISSNRKEA
jgi:hypothetical protein